MADQATQHMVIGASPQRIWDVLTDFDSYPTWARDLKSATVVARDDEGRPLDVAFRAAAMGRSTSYTLRYDYTGAPERMSWELVRGDIMRRLDGSYLLVPVNGAGDRTRVTYHLAVDLIVPLPGFVKRRAERRILNAIKEMKAFAES